MRLSVGVLNIEEPLVGELIIWTVQLTVGLGKGSLM